MADQRGDKKGEGRFDNIVKILLYRDEKINISACRVVCIVFGIICGIFVPVNIIANNTSMVIANMVISTIMFINLFVINKTKKVDFAVPTLTIMFELIVIYYLYSGSMEGFSILWMLLVPTFAFYMLPFKTGFITSLIAEGIFIAVFWTPLGVYFYTYTTTFRIRFPILFMVDIIMSVLIKYQLNKNVIQNKELMEQSIYYKEKAESASRAKSDFLASMSHEIRTPINSILGMNEMILRESREDDTIMFATDIERAGNILLQLVNEILDFSKIESGNIKVVEDEYDLSALLGDVLQLTEPRARKKDIRLIIDVDENVPDRLFGDDVKIRQIVTNLMTNAIKYTDEGGEVNLIVRYSDIVDNTIMLNIAVKDNGRGIKEEDRQKLFNAFQRLDENVNKSIEGTGLGLAISYSYAEIMGGTLQVESEYGVGSSFFTQIPQKVAGIRTIGKFEKNYRNYHITKKDYVQKFTAPDAHILVVDDNEMNLQVVRNLLKKTEVKTDLCRSGQKALVYLENYSYDLMLLDHMMPDMDGIETLRRVRLRYSDEKLPVIALTANAISGARKMYLEKGFQEYLTKPIKGEDLERLVMRFLPPEKVHYVEENADEADKPGEEGEKDSGESGDILYINMKHALEYAGDDQEFVAVNRELFVSAVPETMDELDKAGITGNLESFAVNVHALKNNLFTIGADNLANEAKRLELESKSGNEELISSSWPVFRDNVNKLLEIISKA